MSERPIADEYGFRLAADLPSVSVLGFADDTTPVGNSRPSAARLVGMAQDRFSEIGLSVNVKKCIAIIVEDGKLSEEPLLLDNGDSIPALKEGEVIKYLGVTFQDEIVFDEGRVIRELNEDLGVLVNSQLLLADQKLTILTQFIWPKLIYPFQTAPLAGIKRTFLEAVDVIIRSTVPEMIGIPSDAPKSFFYASRKHRGLGLPKAAWEAYLQILNICRKLQRDGDPLVEFCRDLEGEIAERVRKLGVIPDERDVDDNEDDEDSGDEPFTAKSIRQQLRQQSFEEWRALSQKGLGVSQFKDLPKANSWIFRRAGLSVSEWVTAIKISTYTAPVKGVPGRSTDTRCRRCDNEFESLAHVLGACPFNSLLITSRHNKVRQRIANELRAQGLTVHEEGHCISSTGSNRRFDILAIDKKDKTKAYIVDPTIRFEANNGDVQFADVHREKCGIYDPCHAFLKEAYGLEEIVTYGLFIGARGSFTKQSLELLHNIGIKTETALEIATAVLKDSVRIVNHHFYQQ